MQEESLGRCSRPLCVENAVEPLDHTEIERMGGCSSRFGPGKFNAAAGELPVKEGDAALLKDGDLVATFHTGWCETCNCLSRHTAEGNAGSSVAERQEGLHARQEARDFCLFVRR